MLRQRGKFGFPVGGSFTCSANLDRAKIVGSRTLIFESTDCSGTPLLPDVISDPNQLVFGAFTDTDKVFIPDMNSQRLVHTNSFRSLETGQCTTDSPVDPVSVWDVAEVREFTPPFSIEIEH